VYIPINTNIHILIQVGATVERKKAAVESERAAGGAGLNSKLDAVAGAKAVERVKAVERCKVGALAASRQPLESETERVSEWTSLLESDTAELACKLEALHAYTHTLESEKSELAGKLEAITAAAAAAAAGGARQLEALQSENAALACNLQALAAECKVVSKAVEHAQVVEQLEARLQDVERVIEALLKEVEEQQQSARAEEVRDTYPLLPHTSPDTSVLLPHHIYILVLLLVFAHTRSSN
jgi:chromosome segregation ATPase